jgi:phage shock protein E
MRLLHMFLRPRGLKDLTPEEILRRMQEQPGVRILDVRTPAEYRRGHIKGARLATLGRTAEAVADWPRHTPVILICQSGHRSVAAAHDVLALGFEDVSHLAGGMAAWVRHGAPRVSG